MGALRGLCGAKCIILGWRIGDRRWIIEYRRWSIKGDIMFYYMDGREYNVMISQKSRFPKQIHRQIISALPFILISLSQPTSFLPHASPLSLYLP